MVKRSEMMEVRTARKKLRVELGKELVAKVRALKKASVMCRKSRFFFVRLKLLFRCQTPGRGYPRWARVSLYLNVSSQVKFHNDDNASS